MLKISDDTIEIISDNIAQYIRQGRLSKDTVEGDGGWQDKENLEVLWYNYIKRVDPYEKRYIVIINSMLTKQAKEVFDKIKRYPNNYKKWMFDRKKWLRGFVEAEAKFITKLIKQEGQKAIDLALKLSRKSYYKAEEIPISIAFDVYNPEVTEAMVAQTTKFPAGVVGTSEEIIRREIANGLELGESIDKLRKRVTGRLGPTYIKNRAEMIARSETIYASNAGAELGYMQSGVVEGKKWLTALDERTCAPCTDMNNMTAPIGQPTWEKEGLNIGDVQGKYGLDFDYTEGAMPFPPLHPRCRCTITPIVKVISKKPWKPTMTAKEAEAWAKGSAFEKEVFYHGTSKGAADRISKEGFQLKRLGYNRGNGGLHGAGHYATTSPEYAKVYGEEILKIKIKAKKVLTSYKEFERLESIGYNLAEAAQGRYGTTIAQARRTITDKKLLRALDSINDKDWKVIHEMMSEKFGLEHVQRYIYKKSGYDAILLGDGVETVVLNDKSLVIIKPKARKIPKVIKPTKEQMRKSLEAYQDGGFQKVNGYLRGEKIDPAFISRAKNDIKNMDFLAKVSTDDYYLYRGDGAGISANLFEKIPNLPHNIPGEEVLFGRIGGKTYSQFLNEKLKGLTFTDNAFISTSKNVKLAMENFVGGSESFSKYGCQGFAEIMVKKGTKLIDVEKISLMGAKESEMILARGLKFKIENVIIKPYPHEGREIRFYIRYILSIVK